MSTHPCGVCNGTACTCTRTYSGGGNYTVVPAEPWECGATNHDFQPAPRKQYGHGVEGDLFLFCRKCGATRSTGR